MIWLYDNIEMRIEGTIIVRVQMPLQALRIELQPARRRHRLHCTYGAARRVYPADLSTFCLSMLIVDNLLTQPSLAGF